MADFRNAIKTGIAAAMKMNQKNLQINGQNFTFTTLCGDGYSVGVRKSKIEFDKKHPIIKSVHTTFDSSNFQIVREPIVVDQISSREKFSKVNDLRILDCPIKFPGNPEYRIPHELRQFDEVIAKCVSIEHAINSNVNDYYAYITIDQGYVEENAFQRKPGCHVDGFQGSRIRHKQPINRSYIVYDRVPTVFYPQIFQTAHLNPATDNFFLSFDDQADETKAKTYDRYSILLADAYTVHRSASVDYPVYRTFFRLSYDVNVFDRLGNTHNSLFDYNWKMVARDTQVRLRHKKSYNPNAF